MTLDTLSTVTTLETITAHTVLTTVTIASVTFSESLLLDLSYCPLSVVLRVFRLWKLPSAHSARLEF